MHLHILFTSDSFPTAETTAFEANTPTNDFGPPSPLMPYLASSCCPFLVLFCFVFPPSWALSSWPYSFPLFQWFSKTIILFFFFLLGPCPLPLLSSRQNLPAPEAHCSGTGRNSRSWLLFTSFRSEAGDVYSAAPRLGISFNWRFVMQDSLAQVLSLPPGIWKDLYASQSQIPPSSPTLLA